MEKDDCYQSEFSKLFEEAVLEILKRNEIKKFSLNEISELINLRKYLLAIGDSLIGSDLERQKYFDCAAKVQDLILQKTEEFLK